MKHPIKRLTPEQRETLLAVLPGGGDRASVCDVAGITQVQLQLEMKRDPEFAQAVARAEASMELRQMSKVINATNDEKNWRTSIWWIERRTRERLRGVARSLTEADVFELVDAIACAVAQDLPDSAHLRHMVERLLDIAARKPAALAALSFPTSAPDLEDPPRDDATAADSADAEFADPPSLPDAPAERP